MKTSDKIKVRLTVEIPFDLICDLLEAFIKPGNINWITGVDPGACFISIGCNDLIKIHLANKYALFGKKFTSVTRLRIVKGIQAFIERDNNLNILNGFDLEDVDWIFQQGIFGKQMFNQK